MLKSVNNTDFYRYTRLYKTVTTIENVTYRTLDKLRTCNEQPNCANIAIKKTS